MHKDTKRAQRRHHYNRLKKRRQKLHYWSRYDDNWAKRQLGMAVNTPCNCSCPMCGNPRRHFGDKTMAELRRDDAFRSQIEEAYFYI